MVFVLRALIPPKGIEFELTGEILRRLAETIGIPSKVAYLNARAALLLSQRVHLTTDPKTGNVVLDTISHGAFAAFQNEHNTRGMSKPKPWQANFIDLAVVHYYVPALGNGGEATARAIIEDVRLHPTPVGRKRRVLQRSAVAAPATSAVLGAATNPEAEKNHVRIIRTVDFGRQDEMRHVAGDYLLLRRTFSDKLHPKLIVSYMSIKEERDNTAPVEFVTWGGSDEDNAYTNGIAFCSGQGDLKYYFHGFVQGREPRGGIADIINPEWRSSILMTTQKPKRSDADPRAHDVDEGLRDLRGIRLGLGRNDRLPRGYRLYASRLKEPLPDAEKTRVVKTFQLTRPKDWMRSFPDFLKAYENFAERRRGMRPALIALQQKTSPMFRARQSLVRLTEPADETLLSSHIAGLAYVIDWLSMKTYAEMKAPYEPTWMPGYEAKMKRGQ